MRFPFLSRAAHDEIVALYRARAESAEAAREAAERRADIVFNDLLTRYQSLVERTAKAEGVPPTLETVAPEVDFVLQAAYERWGNDPQSMQFVTRFIAAERAKAKSGNVNALDDAQLLDVVLRGESASDGVEF